MKKINTLGIIILFIAISIPNLALAVWWNPFTWNIFNRGHGIKIEKTIVSTSTIQNINVSQKATTTLIKTKEASVTNKPNIPNKKDSLSNTKTKTAEELKIETQRKVEQQKQAEETARKLAEEKLIKQQEEARIKAEQERNFEAQRLVDKLATEEKQKEAERQQRLEVQRLTEEKAKAEQERILEAQKLADQQAAEERQKEIERQQQLENKRLAEEKVGTKVQGIISQNTIWTLENSPYLVVGNLKIEKGVTLEINPGVVIRFDGNYYLMVAGELKSKGTPQNLVTFTSNKTNPQPGDWETIEFINSAIPTTFNENGEYTSGSIIQFTKVEYAKTGITYKEGNGLLIDNNIIQNNGATSWGGGIYLANISWSKITNNTIRNNSAGTGGGLYLESFRGEVTNNTISDNSSMTFGGGGIFVEIHRGKIENNIINDNKGKRNGGGLEIYNSWVAETTYSQITIKNNHIKNNFAEQGGGGIYLEESKLINLSGNTIENNTAVGGGGIAYLNLDGQIINNIIQNNTAKFSGGGISGNNWSSWRTKLSISHNNILANTSEINTSHCGGGGIYIDDSALIENNIIKQNKALSGNGGSIYIYEEGNIQINNNMFVGNGSINEIYTDTANIDVSNNWWGTTDTSVIESRIYDYTDDFKRGKITYIPFATSELAGAGVQ